MHSDREKKVEELFQVAVTLSTDERTAFFHRHCATDPDLRNELLSLLEHDQDETKTFLRSPVLGVADHQDSSAELPERIGPYLVLRKIGEGGMGAVYLAEEQRTISRRVAIKVIRSGAESTDAATRFDMERRALAMMDHPGIARIFDGGKTDEGDPYMVMEYVDGAPLVRYCDEKRLGLGPRLRLFCQVCEAVQHAHQKGVIHRDLKPSNILVTEHDEELVPKLIDFGIATATRDQETDETAATESAEVLGTYHYMSPEQALPGSKGVDTRSDVYSLGVLLYELLTGVLPVGRAELRGKAPSEIHELLWEQDPPPPSIRLTRLELSIEPLADKRSTDGKTWIRQLEGDLDWITLRAMAKEPERRYVTPMECRTDILRHLGHRPVAAGPPDFGYRMTKFVRRNRVAVAAACSGLAALVIGAAGLAWGLRTASTERDEARESARLAQAAKTSADEALAVAEQKREIADNLSDFLVETVALADPAVSLSANPDLYLVLRTAGSRLPTALPNDPENQALIYLTLGRAFQSVGDLRLAEEHLQQATDLREKSPNATLEERYEAMWQLSRAYGDSGGLEAHDLRDNTLTLALRILEQRSPALADSLYELSTEAADLQAELAAFERATELAEAELPPKDDDWLVLANTFEYIALFLCTSDLELESGLLRNALSIRRQLLDEKHPEIARSVGMLVWVLNEHGNYAGAEDAISEAIDLYKETLPPDHWAIAVAESMLAEALSGQGSDRDAEQRLIQADAKIVAARGRASQAGVDSAYRLTQHYVRRHNFDEAEQYRRELTHGMAFAKNLRWLRGPRRAAFEHQHALFLALQDLRLNEEIDVTKEVIQLIERWQVPNHSDLSLVLARELIDTIYPDPEVNDPDVLEGFYARLLQVLEPHAELFPRETVDAWWNRAEVAEARGELAGAAECLEAASRINREHTDGITEHKLMLQLTLASNLVARGFEKEAVESLESCWEACVDEWGEVHGLSQYALACMASLFDTLDTPERIDPFVQRHLQAILDRQTHRSVLDSAWIAIRSGGLSPETYELARRVCAQAQQQGRGEEAYALYLAIAEIRSGHARRGLRRLDELRSIDDDVAAVRDIFRALGLHQLGHDRDAHELLDRLGPLDPTEDYEELRILAEIRTTLGA